MLRIFILQRRKALSDAPRTLADGRYELFEPIGSGGMATVYRAQDHRLGVARAIKVLLPEYASKDRVRARFEAEARTMAVLDHPNIVRVYDVGATSETAWIVMELVEGSSLLAHIGDFGMGVEDCLNIAAKVLAAIDVAHAHGIVHRDIKPHNVLMSDDGVVRITDFGIARSAGLTEDSFTKTGTVMGTWAFMAPEQRVNAKSVDHTADLYGAGATLFAMATGQTPMDLFAADLDPEMLNKVPSQLVPIIRKATRYNREERFPDARAMLEAIEAVREELGIQTATPAPRVTPVPETSPVASTAPTMPERADSGNLQGTVNIERTNVTYVDADIAAPQPAALESDEHHTPLPFRPGHVHVDAPEGPTKPRMRTRDRVVVLVATALILALVIGGQWKRSPGDPPPSDVTQVNSNETPAAKTEITSAVDAPEREINSSASIPKPNTETKTDPTPQSEPAVATTSQATSKPTPKERPEPTNSTVPTQPTEPVERTLPESAAVDGPPVLPPQIVHEPNTVARMGGRMPIQVRIGNLSPNETRTYRVTAFYRAAETNRFERVELVRSRATWTGIIPVTPTMENGVEYFIKAESSSPSARLQKLKSGSNKNPHRVRVSSP